MNSLPNVDDLLAEDDGDEGVVEVPERTYASFVQHMAFTGCSMLACLTILCVSVSLVKGCEGG